MLITVYAIRLFRIDLYWNILQKVCKRPKKLNIQLLFLKFYFFLIFNSISLSNQALLFVPSKCHWLQRPHAILRRRAANLTRQYGVFRLPRRFLTWQRLNHTVRVYALMAWPYYPHCLCAPHSHHPPLVGVTLTPIVVSFSLAGVGKELFWFELQILLRFISHKKIIRFIVVYTMYYK